MKRFSMIQFGRTSAKFLVGASAMAIALGQAHAQDAEPQADVAAASGDIVVTARRREESLQKVPVAVTAFNSETLRRQGVSEVNDLQYNTPNLTAQAALEGRQSTRFFIRGQGAAFGGALPSVVSYLADVPLDAAGGGAFALLDLDSVQVLRGPQGTLFGRNANGGAVVLTPKAPGQDFEGFGEMSYGNYNDMRVSGAVTIPLTPTLSVRLSGQYSVHDGYTKNLTGPDLDNEEQGAWRAFVRWEPVDGLRNDFIYAGVNGSDNGTGAILNAVRPGSAAANYPLPFPLPNQLGPGFATDLANQQAWGPRKTSYLEDYLGNRRNIQFFANTLSYDVGDATIKNITGYQRVKVCSSNVPVTSATNFYLSTCLPNRYSAPISDKIDPSVNLKIWTSETNISGQAFNGDLDYIVGAFFLDSRTPGGLDTFRVSKTSKTSVAVNVSSSQTHDKSQAAYAQGTYKLADNLKLTAGLRYTWDQRATSFGQYQSTTNGIPGTYNCITPGRAATATPDNCYNIYNRKTSDWGYTFGLDYQANPDLLLYVVTRRGYKAGGINNLSTNVNPQYDPEVLEDIEGGFKWGWRLGGMRGHFNAAYFHGWYSGIQQQLVELDPGGGAVVRIGNADGQIDGVELEANIDVTPNFNVSAFYSFLDARYKAGTFIDVGIDASASKFNGVSKNTVGATARYTLPLGQDAGDLNASATYYTRSKAAYASNNVLDPQAFAPAYQIVNARLEWTNVMGGPVTLSAHVDNLFNKNYVVGGFALMGLVGTDARVYGAPRTYGATALYRF